MNDFPTVHHEIANKMLDSLAETDHSLPDAMCGELLLASSLFLSSDKRLDPSLRAILAKLGVISKCALKALEAMECQMARELEDFERRN